MEPVIENVLENAASFTPPGGAIEVSLARDGDMAVIRIADRGPGVDPRHLRPCLRSLCVLSRDTSRRSAIAVATREAHQGLGLWIVKRNVEGLRGIVSAHNREGGGFEVAVRLRIKV